MTTIAVVRKNGYAANIFRTWQSFHAALTGRYYLIAVAVKLKTSGGGRR